MTIFRNTFVFAIGLVISLAVSAFSDIFLIDLSPATGTALNLGAAPTHYFGDHAMGVGAPNEMSQPASPGTGNEIGSGIEYDDVSNLLTFRFAYGSDFGFVDLVGGWSGTHIHGPGAVNFPLVNDNNVVLHDLGGAHTPGSSTNTGSFAGSVTLSAGKETMLSDNELYINIHRSAFGGGEIRGQLITVVPEPTSAGLVLLGGVLALFARRFLLNRAIA